MRVLLDTCVLSELQRPNTHAGVRAQVEAFDSSALFLSAITIGELAKGISLLPPSARKQSLSLWLTTIEQRFGDKILPIDRDVAHLWGEMTARAQSNGVRIPASDGLIAATALRHGLAVVTRDTRHFKATGAIVIDPWTIGDETTDAP